MSKYRDFKVGDKVTVDTGYGASLDDLLSVGVTPNETVLTISSVGTSFALFEEFTNVNVFPGYGGISVNGLTLAAGQDTVEHTGGSSSYYTVKVESPTTKWKLPYEAECNDIIEALNMTFAEANNFKATWRTAAARQGKKKKGNNAVYDAEKCVFFSGRMLVAAKKGDV